MRHPRRQAAEQLEKTLLLCLVTKHQTHTVLVVLREVFHAGPRPFASVVSGEQEAGLPQIEEQPVALEMNIRSPKLSDQAAML